MKYPKIDCPYEGCEFTTKLRKKFRDHVEAVHGMPITDVYVRFRLAGVEPTCGCGCGKVPKWHGWHTGFSEFIRGHNVRVETAFTDPATIEKMKATRKENYAKGKFKVWNDGLTKESDPRIASSSAKAAATLRKRYRSGEITSWQLGKTKGDCESLEKMSQTKKQQYADGTCTPWNAGLTKADSEALARAADKISQAYQQRQAGKRLSPHEVRSRIEASGFQLVDGEYRSKKKTALVVRCDTCGMLQDRTLYSIEKSKKCFLCSPKESNGHLEILEFLDSCGVHAESNDRTVIAPYELDITIPSQRLAIEFNGLYWHSEEHKGKEYHDMKTRMCGSAGWDLLHVFEDDWVDRQDIVKSMILNRLLLIEKRIPARKCTICQPTIADRRRFFDENHIDGDVSARHAIGLEFEGELVAVASVRKPFHRKWKSHLELARFAVKRHSVVQGGLSRLLDKVKTYARDEGYDGLISYVDTRYGTGHSYTKNGFTLASHGTPTFWWTDFAVRMNRFKYRADRDNGLSEKDVAERAGAKKIWGCRQKLFRLDFNA